MKRKIVAVVLASTMVFGMTACGSSGASDSSNTGSDAATDDTATDDGSVVTYSFPVHQTDFYLCLTFKSDFNYYFYIIHDL